MQEESSQVEYEMLGSNVPMGDHKVSPELLNSSNLVSLFFLAADIPELLSEHR